MGLRKSATAVAHPIAHRIPKTGPRLAVETVLADGADVGPADAPKDAVHRKGGVPAGQTGKRPKGRKVGAPAGSTPDVLDADLARIVASWPTLPEPIRRAMLALIG